MIIGVGIDLVSISRIERERELDPGWRENVFTPHEIEYCEEKRYPAQHYAARFAAKEAFFKALPGNPPRGLHWREIEISNQPNGQPLISLSGCIRSFTDRLRIRSICLSLSHTRDLAIAGVLIDADTKLPPTTNNEDAE